MWPILSSYKGNRMIFTALVFTLTEKTKDKHFKFPLTCKTMHL